MNLNSSSSVCSFAFLLDVIVVQVPLFSLRQLFLLSETDNLMVTENESTSQF